MPMEIQTPEGRVKAMTPVILSASRSTDIPAYYGQWFMNRLRAGWCAWVNPFNRRPSYVSFRDVKAVVFWTKNPAPFLQHLDELDAALRADRSRPRRLALRSDHPVAGHRSARHPHEDLDDRQGIEGTHEEARRELRRRGRLSKGPGEPRARHGSLHSRDRAVGRTRRGAEARDLRGPRQDPRTLAFGRLGH